MAPRTNSWHRRLLPGVDEPFYRDWLVWLALLLIATWTGLQARATGWVALAGIPLGFLLFTWVLAALRNVVRGYRDK